MAKKKIEVITQELEGADLMTILAEGVSSDLFDKNKLVDFSYSTGIPVIDYLMGYEALVKDPVTKEVIKKRQVLGIQAGSFNILTGKSQSYKTTVGMNIISNIGVSANGNIVHYDAEGRLVLQRAKTITQLPDEWFNAEHPRYALKSGTIGFDRLKRDIAEIYESKMKHKDLLLKDTGEVDDKNQPIILMPPTLVFIDSLQHIVINEDAYDINDKQFQGSKELRNNMVGAITAKTIRGFISDIIPMQKEANIIVLCVAHKTGNVSTNSFLAPSKQFQYGSVSERISGGSAVEYDPSALMSFTGYTSKDTMYSKDTDGFDGNLVLFEPIKCSTNQSGNAKTGISVDLVIDKGKDGVDNYRTLSLFLKSKGRLKGNNAGWKVINADGTETETRYKWKTIYEDLEKDRGLSTAFFTAAKEELDKLISPAVENVGKKPMNINDMLKSLGSE